MKRALVAGTVYFLTLFALGFALGTVRVTLIEPRIGALAATAAEVPVMLAAGFLACRWIVDRWGVSAAGGPRLAMALWFIGLLLVSETVLGAALFGRSGAQQWAALGAPAGLLGLSAQIVAASLPLFVRRAGPN